MTEFEVSNETEYDAFISYSSDDKEIVNRLAMMLENGYDLRVWYDDFEIELGDSIRREITRGLKNSNFGIVVLSHSFFEKEWPQRELDSLVTRETNENQEKIILPLKHDISIDEIRSYSPQLASVHIGDITADNIRDISKNIAGIVGKNNGNRSVNQGQSNESEKQQSSNQPKRRLQSEIDTEQIVDVANTLLDINGLTEIEARVLAAIDKVFDYTPFTQPELKEALENTEIPVSEGLLIQLLEAGKLEKINKQNPPVFIYERGVYSLDEIRNNLYSIIRTLFEECAENRIKTVSKTLGIEPRGLESNINNSVYSEGVIKVIRNYNEAVDEYYDLQFEAMKEGEQQSVDLSTVNRIWILNNNVVWKMSNEGQQNLSKALKQLEERKQREREMEYEQTDKWIVTEAAKHETDNLVVVSLGPGKDRTRVCPIHLIEDVNTRQEALNLSANDEAFIQMERPQPSSTEFIIKDIRL